MVYLLVRASEQQNQSVSRQQHRYPQLPDPSDDDQRRIAVGRDSGPEPGRRQEHAYFADSVNCPYGPRPLEEVRKLSKAITAFLIQVGKHFFYTSSDPKAFADMMEKLIGKRGEVGD